MDIYQKQFKLRNADVDVFRRLRPSVLLTMLQEAAIAHTEELGMGRDKTLDRGLLWVVVLQQIAIHRMPEYDETVTLLTWAGKTMHVFFPRYFRLTGADGELLLEGCALWTLMDQNSRSAVFPDEHDVVIHGVVTGMESAIPRPPRSIEPSMETSFTVPYSYLDLNGHMNNVRYLDLAEDVLPPALHPLPLREIQVEYTSEARLGETVCIRMGNQDNSWFLLGQTDKRLFRMRLTYGDAAQQQVPNDK